MNRKSKKPKHLDELFEMLKTSEDRYLKRKEKSSRENENIQNVHKELSDINDKLQLENKRLYDWEVGLKKRERKLCENEEKFNECAQAFDEMVKLEVEKNSRDHVTIIEELQEENKKLRRTLQTLKKANEKLRCQFSEEEAKVENFEEQQMATQNRIIILQRQVELLKSKSAVDEEKINALGLKLQKRQRQEKQPKASEKGKTSSDKLIAELFSWACENELRSSVHSLIHTLRNNQTTEHDVSTEQMGERSFKILLLLPSLIECFRGKEQQLIILQFIYWSLLHSLLSKSSQRCTRSATFRKIGELIYFNAKNEKFGYFNNSDPHIKLVSCLIIFNTITQADILVRAFQTLNSELHKENIKELFISYHGTYILYPLFKLTNWVNLQHTADLLMVMAGESAHLQKFLESVSTVEWIQSILTVMKSCQSGDKLLEKLSLLLQRISKIRSNKPIFEALQTSETIFQLSLGCEQEFVKLNLRSILVNLEQTKTRKTCVS